MGMLREASVIMREWVRGTDNLRGAKSS